LSNRIFSPSCGGGQWISRAKLEKIIDDYIRSRDEWRRAVQKMLRFREEFIRCGLISLDEKESGQ
jgi:hypothetical protein